VPWIQLSGNSYISILFTKAVESSKNETYLFHIWPMNPAWGLESWKLARRAAAAASMELRFWLTRPAKATPWEDCFEERHVRIDADA